MANAEPADYLVREAPRTPPPPDAVRRDAAGELARVDERFERHVRTSAELLARDLAALLDRAHALGVAVIPDHDEVEGISYEIEWCYKTMRSLTIEWDARNQCHRVLTATTAPTERVEATGDLDAHYEHTQRYVIRYQPATWPREKPMPAFVWGGKGWWYRQALTEYWDAHGLAPKPHAAPDEVQRAVDWWNQRAVGEPAAPVHISYMAGASGEEIERAKQAVIGTVVEMVSEMHARFACPGWQYTTTEGPRKQWSDADTPPEGEGWERNTDAGRDGWDRFDYSERSYWRRPVPERERLVHDDPQLAAQIREGIAQAERGETVDLGSFARHLDESDDDD